MRNKKLHDLEEKILIRDSIDELKIWVTKNHAIKIIERIVYVILSVVGLTVLGALLKNLVL